MENVEVIRLSDVDFEIIADAETLQLLFEEEDKAPLRRRSVTIDSESDLLEYNDTELIDTHFEPDNEIQQRRRSKQEIACIVTGASVAILACSIVLLFLFWMDPFHWSVLVNDSGI